jgi:hypothetical protein
MQALHDFINRIERYFYRLALHKRERKMGSEYYENLSREMDCLQFLIDGSNDHTEAEHET